MTETVKCPKCGEEVRGGGKFCPGCGAPIGTCLHCGAKMEPGQRFCPECGTPAGQRRREEPAEQLPENLCPGCRERARREGKPLCGPCETLSYRSPGDPKSFGEAWKRGWKVSFNGRASRQEFWWRFGGTLIEALVLGGIFLVGIYAEETNIVWLAAVAAMGVVIGGIAELYALLASLGLRVRRLHDLGWSGWWILLECVFPVFVLVEFVLDCLPGQKTANQYGLPPELVARLKTRHGA